MSAGVHGLKPAFPFIGSCPGPSSEKLTAVYSKFPFYTVAPNSSGSAAVAIDPVAFESQKMLGIMLVTPDNASGAAEAQLIRAPGTP